MNQDQVKDYCMRYLNATNCQIIEKDPAFVKVKLSPEADRDLTGRTYYWSFVERTGAEPETMSFVFVFDPERRQPPEPPSRGTTIGRIPIVPHSERMIEETVSFGSRRLDQMFSAAHSKGSYLQLFEETPPIQRGTTITHQYTTWLGVNYRVEFTCDMKREELHSLGICMSTGEIVTDFQRYLTERALSTRMPAHCQLREVISLERAVHQLEAYLEKILQQADYEWALLAHNRMREEVHRIQSYYESLLPTLDGEQKEDMQAQYARRHQEIEWQYRPRIEVKMVNCGWFHLLNDTFTNTAHAFVHKRQKKQESLSPSSYKN